MYKILEDSGALCCFGAYQGETMIGFITVLTHVMPHYGALIATTESFFVAKAYRKTGAGTLLRQTVERHAQGRGAAGVLICAPYGGQLAKVLPRAGYRQTNQVFFKGLS